MPAGKKNERNDLTYLPHGSANVGNDWQRTTQQVFKPIPFRSSKILRMTGSSEELVAMFLPEAFASSNVGETKKSLEVLHAHSGLVGGQGGLRKL